MIFRLLNCFPGDLLGHVGDGGRHGECDAGGGGADGAGGRHAPSGGCWLQTKKRSENP